MPLKYSLVDKWSRNRKLTSKGIAGMVKFPASALHDQVAQPNSSNDVLVTMAIRFRFALCFDNSICYCLVL